MSSTELASEPAAVPLHGDADPVDGSASQRRLFPFLVMLASVTVSALLPFLGFRQFYLSGDSISQWLPVSRRIGELLLNGDSHLMDPTLWRSGNFVAEARFGLWNPLAVLLDVTLLQIDDLALATFLAALIYLLLLAAGVYLLAREYGATAWWSAVGGAVVATGGWTLWMDASWWIPQLASLAFTPFVWVAARRFARGVSGPIWFVLAGAMCVTSGNPYGNIVVFVIVVAVLVEFGERTELRRAAALVISLIAIGCIAIFVYLPFRQTSIVGFREAGLENNESWAPNVGDFLSMSSPTATPFVRNFGRSVLGFPALYLSWFILPLAPWVRWRGIARRHFAGLGVFAGVLFLLAMGPSSFWLFRWPIRLVPYIYLPVLVGAVVLLSKGLATDQQRRRASISAGVVVIGAYLSWADVPEDLWWHVAGMLAVLVASAAAVIAGLRSRSSMAPLMIAATVIILAIQLQWRPQNDSVRHYGAPESAAAFVESFDGRYDGNVIQIASFDKIPLDDRNADAAYRDLTVGSSFAIGGTESISVYSGIGFATHDSDLCIAFDGAMCADVWARLWRSPDGSGTVLADLIAAETVVVQRALLDTRVEVPPHGWELAESTPYVDVWKRIAGREWPDGRLTGSTGPVTVSADRSDGPHREVVQLSRDEDGPAQLTFARLAWPGYEAAIDDRPLLVGGGPAGLLVVEIPADLTGDLQVELTWRPPLWKLSLLALAFGLLLAIATQAAWLLVGRARST
jgi:hypothetical protein